MGPLPLTLLLILASPSCLGMRTHSLDATRHHAEHPGSDQGSSVGPDHPHRYPPYMMQLYQHYKSVDMKETGAGSGDHDALDQTDSIVSLVAKDWHQVGERWKVTFDMSSLSDSQEIWLSELRFHDSVFSASTVELYHAHDSTPERSVLLGSIKITPSYSSSSSWKVFNITHLLTRWLHQGGEEQWHALQTEDETDSVVEEGSGNEMTGTSPPHKIEDLGIDQVMIVVFLKSILTQSHQNSSTLMQTVQHSKYVVLNQSDNARRLKRNQIEPGHVQELGSENVTLSGTGSLQRPLCRRVDMWVDFDRIGWNEWIVHPKRYNAYRCEGECPVPLDESFKPTNHAYMQSLLKYHHPERVTCVSCVPKSLSSLSMLYYEGDDIVLHHHEDMIVEECSCQ